MSSKEQIDAWLNSEFPDQDTRFRAGLIINFSVIAAVFAVFYILLTLINHLIEVRYMMFADVVLFSAVLAILRLTKSVFWSAQLYVLICWLTTFGLIYVTGGTHSIILAWLPIVPLVALLLIDRMWAWIWLGLATIQLLMYWLYDYLDLALPYYPITATSVYIVPVAFGILVILLWITQVFDSRQRQLRNQLISSNKQLVTSEEELRKNLEEVRAIQEVITQREQELRTNKEKLEYYNHLLMDVVKSKSIQQGFLDHAINHILEVAAEGLKVSRASIWQYQTNPASIVCLNLYQWKDKHFEKGMVLKALDFPSYFKNILSEGIISAADARTNLATREFKESYLLPLDIHSMLDVPFYVNGNFYGVLCFEQQQTMRVWSAEDSSFAKSLADITSLAFVSANRRAAKEQIIAQGLKIMEQHDQLKSYAEEIQAINQQLEKRVAERTEKLMIQAERMREYSFINAHLLRGPSCRIQGLLALLNSRQLSAEEEKLVLHYLDVSATELDDIIRRITKTLDASEVVLVAKE
jgi:GAF domain-containing protein